MKKTSKMDVLEVHASIKPKKRGGKKREQEYHNARII